jgi:hypothetical protein
MQLGRKEGGRLREVVVWEERREDREDDGGLTG